MYDNFQIEFGLWHNGKIAAGLYYQSVPVRRGDEFSVNLPDVVNGARAYVLRCRVTSELVEDWFAMEAGLFDTSNAPISTIRPALVYVKPSDCPSTVTFPSLLERPLHMAGIWVVAMRGVGSIEMERERFAAKAAT